MTILLTPDDSVAENTVYVAIDVDADVLAALKTSNFDIIVDPRASNSGLRMAPALVNRICKWETLRDSSSVDQHPQR